MYIKLKKCYNFKCLGTPLKPNIPSQSNLVEPAARFPGLSHKYTVCPKV